MLFNKIERFKDTFFFYVNDDFMGELSMQHNEDTSCVNGVKIRPMFQGLGYMTAMYDVIGSIYKLVPSDVQLNSKVVKYWNKRGHNIKLDIDDFDMSKDVTKDFNRTELKYIKSSDEEKIFLDKLQKEVEKLKNEVQ